MWEYTQKHTNGPQLHNILIFCVNISPMTSSAIFTHVCVIRQTCNYRWPDSGSCKVDLSRILLRVLFKSCTLSRHTKPSQLASQEAINTINLSYKILMMQKYKVWKKSLTRWTTAHNSCHSVFVCLTRNTRHCNACHLWVFIPWKRKDSRIQAKTFLCNALIALHIFQKYPQTNSMPLPLRENIETPSFNF